MYVTNTIIPLVALAQTDPDDRRPEDKYDLGGPVGPEEGKAIGKEWDELLTDDERAIGESAGLGAEAMLLLRRVGELDELDIRYAEAGKQMRDFDPESAMEHDDVRRKFNEAARDVVYPEGQMHFPKSDGERRASTECLRAPTECAGRRATAQSVDERTARVGITNDPVHGIVPMNTYDMKEFVKKMDRVGHVRVVVDVDGEVVDSKELGEWLAEAVGTRTREGKQVAAAYIVAGVRPGQILYDFTWR